MAVTGAAVTAQDAAEGADHAAGVEIAAGEITAADRYFKQIRKAGYAGMAGSKPHTGIAVFLLKQTYI